jgi:hypothetical protein
MPTVNGQPYTGPIIIDLSDVKPELIDLAQGAMSRLRQEQEGIKGVLTELQQNVPAHGDEAGIAPAVYQRIVDATASIERLSVHEIELEKALEVVRETKAKKMHDRENDIGAIARTVKQTASDQSKPEIAAPFQHTTTYASQVAEKALHTRKKNEAEKKAAEGSAPPAAAQGSQAPAAQAPAAQDGNK